MENKKCCFFCKFWTFDDFETLENNKVEFLGDCEIWEDKRFESQVCEYFEDALLELEELIRRYENGALSGMPILEQNVGSRRKRRNHSVRNMQKGRKNDKRKRRK